MTPCVTAYRGLPSELKMQQPGAFTGTREIEAFWEHARSEKRNMAGASNRMPAQLDTKCHLRKIPGVLSETRIY
jgi:hypothetical protein